MNYHNTVPIIPSINSTWLIEYDNGLKMISIWHHKAKIEEIIEFINTTYPQHGPFTVANVNVGTFGISYVDHSMSNGRKVNQNYEVVL